MSLSPWSSSPRHYSTFPQLLQPQHQYLPMVLHTEELRSRSKSEKRYEVTIHKQQVQTTVTSSSRVATKWINDHLQAPWWRRPKIVGLDIEWRPMFIRGAPQNPVATLQLCHRKFCLIFQIYCAPSIPDVLADALSNPNIFYTGVRVSEDVEKLTKDYDLEVCNVTDVADLAADVFDNEDFRKAGLKALVETVIGEVMDKPKHVSTSNWDAEELTCAQVQYACVDAYYSFKLGEMLLRGKSRLGKRFPKEIGWRTSLRVWVFRLVIYLFLLHLIHVFLFTHET